MQTPAEDGGSAGSPVTMYYHRFDYFATGSIGQPFSDEADQYSDYVSNMSWTTNHPGGLTMQSGNSVDANNKALSLPTAQPASSTMTLSLDVRPDYEASVSGFSFYIRNDNSNGYKNWNLVINGQSVGSGVVTSSFVQQSVTLSTPIRGLKGAVTVQLTVTNSNGSTATNYLRVDDFKLVGFVERSPMLTGGNKVIHEADFTSSTGGWEPNNGITTVSLDNGRLKVAASDVWGAPRKRLSLVAGKTYRISFTWDKGNGSALTVAFKRPNEAVFYWGDIPSINSSGRYTMFFTVPAGESTLDWFFDQPPGASTIPSYYWLDDIVIEEVDDPIGEGSEVGDSDGNGYRYGFNGKENDNDVKGDGNQQDYGFRIYDPRLGKFLSVDPLARDYPWYTPYQFAGNSPITFIDADGLEPVPGDPNYGRNLIFGNYKVVNTVMPTERDVTNVNWLAQKVRTLDDVKLQMGTFKDNGYQIQNVYIQAHGFGAGFAVVNLKNGYTDIADVDDYNSAENLSAADINAYLKLKADLLSSDPKTQQWAKEDLESGFDKYKKQAIENLINIAGMMEAGGNLILGGCFTADEAEGTEFIKAVSNLVNNKVNIWGAQDYVTDVTERKTTVTVGDKVTTQTKNVFLDKGRSGQYLKRGWKVATTTNTVTETGKDLQLNSTGTAVSNTENKKNE